MREQQIGITRSAQRRGLDVVRQNAGIKQLSAVGFDQVEEDLDRQLAVARRTRAEKQQRIFLPHGVGFFDFVEEFSRVGELGLEVPPNLFPDRVTAIVNARTNRRQQIGGPAAKVLAHLAYSFFRNPLHCSTPAGMEHRNRTLLRIYQDDRKAISSLNREHQTRRIGYQTIADRWVIRHGSYTMDNIGVHLPQGNEM